MWTTRCEELKRPRALQIAIDRDACPATFADVLQGWQTDASFRSLFNSLLAKAPYSAFRWETPAVTATTLTQPFEFVLLDDPTLARRPDQTPFAKQLNQAQTDVAVFSNLGGDAIMVVPCPIADSLAYGHLAAFTRLAPDSQRDALWQAVGTAMTNRIGNQPVWLSTAGAGVSWLHVRLDNRPKYYSFVPYKNFPGP